MSATEVETPAPAVDRSDLSARVVILSLRMSTYRTTRRIDPDAIAAAGREDRLRVKNAALDRVVSASKKILESKTLKEIDVVISRIATDVRKRANKASFLRPGMYAISNGVLPQVLRDLENGSALVDQLAAQFIEEYADRENGPIAEAQARLSPLGLWDPRDYVVVSELERHFGVRWNYWSFDVPTQLREIDASAFEDAKRRASAEWAEAYKEFRGWLRQEALDLVSGLVRKLTPNNDGDKRVIRTSALEGLSEFLQNLPLRNVTDDKPLLDAMEKVRGLMRGVDVNDLRDMEGLRKRVASQLDVASKTLAALVEEEPVRQITFEE